MIKKFAVPRGTSDTLPEEIPFWANIESKARSIFSIYNYSEIRTPIFEETGLFKRSLGQTSDVVNKQLLELVSSKEEGFALRPEGTASVVRSYIENSLHKKESVSKFFYIGPMFRGERPQKGRLRQFHQIGAEVIGPATLSPYFDAEVISLSIQLLRSFGLDDYKLKINTLGTAEDKEKFSSYLRSNLKEKLSSLCEDCRSRFERNVFRVLDCKNRGCQDVVKSLKLDHSYLSPESQNYYAQVKGSLKDLNVAFEESVTLVRGLDYYNHTVFELTSSGLGSQDAVGAGGRYNQLVAQLGGEDKDVIGSVGFSLGMERILIATKDRVKLPESRLDVFIIALNDNFLPKAFKLLNALRQQGVSSDMSFAASSMKSQMRAADRSKARHVIIWGEDEDQKGILTVKNMQSGEQKQLHLSDLSGIVKHISI